MNPLFQQLAPALKASGLVNIVPKRRRRDVPIVIEAAKMLGSVAIVLAVCVGVVVAADRSELVIVQSSEPIGLDAMKNNLQHSLNVALNVQDRLFEPLDSGDVAPALAQRWEFIDENTLQVILKPNLTFHNGEAVNAEAVKFSFDRLFDPKIASPHAGRMQQIESVSIIDDLAVQFRTKRPFAPILHLLSYYFPIVPPMATSRMSLDDFNRRPLGAGPYKVESWERGGDIVLKAFENHWAGTPAYKTVIFRAIPEESARVASLLAGESDIVEGVSISSQEIIKRSGKGSLTDSMGVMPYVGLNSLEGPFRDQRVRQAVNYGVNRALIREALFNNRGALAAGPISSRTFGANPALEPYPYDAKKAKELLAEAGFPGGFRTTLSYPSNVTQIHEQAQAIASDLARIGVKVALRPLERPVMWQKYKDREHQMYIYWWDDNPEPDRYLYSLFHSSSRGYYYRNAVVDAMLEDGRSTFDRDRRAAIYAEIDRKIHEEAPWLFLYVVPETYAVALDVSYVGRRDGFLLARFAKPRNN